MADSKRANSSAGEEGMKLWQKDKTSLLEVEKFTVGKDKELDLHLAPFDLLGSLAHIKMLESVGLLSKEELTRLETGLKNNFRSTKTWSFLLLAL